MFYQSKNSNNKHINFFEFYIIIIAFLNKNSAGDEWKFQLAGKNNFTNNYVVG